MATFQRVVVRLGLDVAKSHGPASGFLRSENMCRDIGHLPSGNLLHSYGKTLSLMVTSTVNGDFP